MLVYSPALFVTGAVALGYGLVRQRLHEEGPVQTPQLFPKVLKAARMSERMLRQPHLVMNASRQKKRLANVDHELLRSGLKRHVLGPFCCATWREQDKLDRVVDHFRTVTGLGGILKPHRGEVRLLCELPSFGPDYSLKIDEADWMLSDGLTVLSLWKGIDRMFSITFMLSSIGGELICLVGGLQGRGGEDMLGLYREMTREAHGVRPRDFIIELHRMFCQHLGVKHIYAIADSARYCYDTYFGSDGLEVTSLDYDSSWRDRGGQRVSKEWFELPIAPVRRAAEEIPAKKRSLYRQRYAMLDGVDDEVAAAMERMIPADARDLSWVENPVGTEELPRPFSLGTPLEPGSTPAA